MFQWRFFLSMFLLILHIGWVYSFIIRTKSICWCFWWSFVSLLFSTFQNNSHYMGTKCVTRIFNLYMGQLGAWSLYSKNAKSICWWKATRSRWCWRAIDNELTFKIQCLSFFYYESRILLFFFWEPSSVKLNMPSDFVGLNKIDTKR